MDIRSYLRNKAQYSRSQFGNFREIIPDLEWSQSLLIYQELRRFDFLRIDNENLSPSMWIRFCTLELILPFEDSLSVTQPCPRGPPQFDTIADLRSRRADVIRTSRDCGQISRELASHELIGLHHCFEIFHLKVDIDSDRIIYRKKLLISATCYRNVSSIVVCYSLHTKRMVALIKTTN